MQKELIPSKPHNLIELFMNLRKYQVAVILINYNSSQYTLDCVKSIFEKTSDAVNYQIIIVDNNSVREEFQKLDVLKDIAGVQIIRSKINTGFSGANMLGVQFADSDYYYFLNNDCLLLNDCITILHNFSESNPQVANCSGEMYNAEMEYSRNFGFFPSLALKLLGSGVLKIFYPSNFPSKYKKLENPTQVDLVNGSSMFIKAIPFEEVGGMDTNYFLYCEEEDIALRLRRKGYSSYLIPEAHYQHFISKSTKFDNSINLTFLKEFYISLLYFYRKNYGNVYCFSIQVLLFLKMLRKFYKNWDYVRLAFFILNGAHFKHSLRFKQKISPN